MQPLPLPITDRALTLANQFARQQPTPEKAAQVQLNTLAVCVVDDYLQMIGIATDRAIADSWNPVVRLCADVADLEVVGLGRLECRPLQSSATCPIPAEVWQDRIGYVVVQLDVAARQAQLLGFVETAAVEALPLDSLQAPEALLNHLDRLRSPAAVNLRQWIENSFSAGWETVESLLGGSELNLAIAFRGDANLTIPASGETIRRAKRVDLGMQFADRPIALVLELIQAIDPQVDIRVQVHPLGYEPYLPPNLRLTILDDTAAIFLEAQSRQADNYIQLQFSGAFGERFGVQITLEQVSIVEQFLI